MRHNKSATAYRNLIEYNLRLLKEAGIEGKPYEDHKRLTEHIIHATTLFVRELWDIRAAEELAEAQAKALKKRADVMQQFMEGKQPPEVTLDESAPPKTP